MLSDTPRQIVGVFRTPNGQTFPNATLFWFRQSRSVVAQGASVILEEPFPVALDSVGSINAFVIAGEYLVRVRLQDSDRYFEVGVPDQPGPLDISTLVDGPAPSAPDDLTAFEALVNKAKAWAQAAEGVEVETGAFSAFHHAQKASTDAGRAEAARDATGLAALVEALREKPE